MSRLRPNLAAYAADVTTATLRKWVQRGHIPPPVNGLYDMEAIREWGEQRSHRHALSARYQRGTTRRPPSLRT